MSNDKQKIFKNRIAGRIAATRLDRGFTQAQIGKKLGVTTIQVCRWETGVNEISLFNAVKLAYLLEASMDELFA